LGEFQNAKLRQHSWTTDAGDPGGAGEPSPQRGKGSLGGEVQLKSQKPVLKSGVETRVRGSTGARLGKKTGRGEAASGGGKKQKGKGGGGKRKKKSSKGRFSLTRERLAKSRKRDRVQAAPRRPKKGGQTEIPTVVWNFKGSQTDKANHRKKRLEERGLPF